MPDFTSDTWFIVLASISTMKLFKAYTFQKSVFYPKPCELTHSCFLVRNYGTYLLLYSYSYLIRYST